MNYHFLEQAVFSRSFLEVTDNNLDEISTVYSEPSMFFNLALEASDARDIQRANLQIILQGVEDYFSQKSIAWLTTPR